MRWISRARTSVLVVALVAPGTSIVPSAAMLSAAGVKAPEDRLVDTKPFVVNEPRGAASDLADADWVNPRVTLPPVATAEVDVPAKGWAKAGVLPVSIALPDGGAAPSRVRVRMLGQDEVKAAGGRLLGFELARADGGDGPTEVAVSVDYSGIDHAYGGNFGSRLRLVEVGSCEEPGCAPASAGATNEVTDSRLTAPRVNVGSTRGGATTYALVSSAAGPNGDYGATPMSASDAWSVGIGSGAFTYSYPIVAPPAVAGPTPSLAVTYNSQSVDGRTTESNTQPSKVGEGWSFEPGFIERKFHSCRDESVARDDLCWSADNEYFISFMGRSGELVRTSGTSNEWRIRGNDPGWRILSFNACCGNGDNDGEYFVAITPDGTKYWFGYGIEPRNTTAPDTHSTLTVPVFGGTGEPCANTVSASAWCQQAWRWNVDRVLDPNDNVTTYFYTKEKNRYSRNGTTSTEYDRAGYLKRVEYGQRNLNEDDTAYARIRVNVTDRCVSQVNCPAPTTSSAQTSYPDIPLDRMCTSTTACASDQTAPTFWSTKQISSIETEYTDVSPAQYEPVSTYRFSYSFPTTGDGTSPSLWLTDIERTGEYGIGSTALPAVRMTGIAKPNRVNSGTGVPPLNKYRVASISSELGARIDVTYDIPDQCPANTAVAWDTNPYLCFPAWYKPDTGTAGWVPFHKYVVTKTVLVDVRGGQPDRETTYTYAGTPAWHYGDSILAPATSRSWNDYRGYADVRVNVAGGGASEGTDTRYLVFRGMDGDKLTSGSVKSAELTDSLGAVFNDFDYRAGLYLEVKNYDASDGHFASMLYRYWSQQTINGPNGHQSHDAYYVRPSKVIKRTKNLDSGAWRNHEVEMTYDATTAALLTTSDEQMPGVTTDDTCTKFGYTDSIATGTAGGSTEWMVDKPYRTLTYAGACGSGSTTVVSETQWDYDGHAYQAVPTNGNVTQTREFIDATDKAITKTAYDALGRVTSMTPPSEVAAGRTDGATTTTYDPPTGYPANGITVTTPPRSTTSTDVRQTTTTVLYSAFGTVRRLTDANADTTAITVDHLGRTTSVSRPGEPTGLQSVTYDYRVTVGVPNRITTNRLVSGTTYVPSYEYFDGLGRSIQTQEPDPNGVAGQRRVAMTRYDSLGQVAAVTQAFGNDDAGAGVDLATVALSEIPFETRYGYDSAGRVYVATDYSDGVSRISHRTEHRGWHYVVDAPVRSDVDYHFDVADRITKVVERPTTGTITTQYEYTPLGDLSKITDQAGNVTSYSYDRLGRRTSTSDPDQGTWVTTYTPDGDVKTVRDARLDPVTSTYDVLHYTYDRIRRLTEVRSDSATGTLHAKWTYDKNADGTAVTNGIGRLVAATSYDPNNAAYTYSVTGYDNRGRATGKKFSLPTAAGALAGDYSYSFDYNLADDMVSMTMPAAGGLAQETVTTELNSAGEEVGLVGSIGNTRYLHGTTYRSDGRVSVRSLLGGDVQRTMDYDTTLGRLKSTVTTAPVTRNGTTATETIENVVYGYDADSNVTSITDGLAGTATTAQRECFEYDPLNRLTEAFTTDVSCSDTGASFNASHGTDAYRATYAYDVLGNITQTETTVGGTTTTTPYVYTGSGHAHAPKTVGGNTYAYDGNGATTTRPVTGGNQTLVWNRLHQLLKVTGPNTGDETSFVYDADGKRLLRSGGDTKTLYLDGMEVTATTDQNNATTVAAKRYYGGVAMRSTAGVTVLLRNRQNSTSVAYDATAKSAEHQRYMPFGRRRGTAALSATERRFLDKTEDATGLVSVGARYYDPVISRFVSADPLADLGKPQSLATYSYSLNNPVSLSDPSGLAPIDADGAGGSRNCDTGCTNEQLSREYTFEKVLYDIKQGVAPDDYLVALGDFDEAQKRVLTNAFLDSPCSHGSADKSACQGHSHGIHYCQMQGQGDCAERAAKVAETGSMLTGLMMEAFGAFGKINRSGASTFKSARSQRLSAARAMKALPALRVRLKTIQSKFKHARDFGIEDPWSPAAGAKFQRAIEDFVGARGTKRILGTYLNKPAILNYNPRSKLVVVQRVDGEFVSGWKMSDAQLWYVHNGGGKLGGH